MKPAVIAVLLCLVLAGCGPSSSPQITIGAARTYRLTGFPSRFPAGKPTPVTFRIDTPSGAALARWELLDGADVDHGTQIRPSQ